MKKLLFVTTCMAIFTQTWAQKLTSQKVGEHVTISVPENFRLLPEEEIAALFYTYRKPMAVFKDPNSNAVLSVNTAEMQWPESDVELLAKFYKASLPTMYSDIVFEEDEVKKINGKKAVLLKFQSSVKADKTDIMASSAISKFNYLLYTIHLEEIYIINFSCSVGNRSYFEEQISMTMESLKIK